MTNPLAAVPRETITQLHDFAAMVREENDRQNLVSKSTLEDFWERHIIDCAQLVSLPGDEWNNWMDVGSGAGLPGLVVAILTGRSICLIEPRAKRAAFLVAASARLSLGNVEVVARNARAVHVRADVISARAVATLTTLFSEAVHLSHSGTTWVLPKGKKWREEMVEACESWHGEFRAVPSVTSPDAAVIVATGVRKRASS